MRAVSFIFDFKKNTSTLITTLQTIFIADGTFQNAFEYVRITICYIANV